MRRRSLIEKETKEKVVKAKERDLRRKQITDPLRLTSGLQNCEKINVLSYTFCIISLWQPYCPSKIKYRLSLS